MKTTIKFMLGCAAALALSACEDKTTTTTHPVPPPVATPVVVAPPAPQIPPELKQAVAQEITAENAEKAAAALEKELAADLE